MAQLHHLARAQENTNRAGKEIMGLALLIGITWALGCLALGLGLFVLKKPLPSSQGD